MKSFQHILVMGAGAVGGYFGGRIAQHTKSKVTFIARGSHLRKIQQHGLKIESVDGNAIIDAAASDNPHEAPHADLILFAVKSYDTPAAITHIKPVVGVETQILTLQNGIENYPRLVTSFGRERVIRGFCNIGAGIKKPGVIEHKALGEITIGDPNGQVSERMIRVKKLGDEAQIPIHIAKDIRREVWIKFSWNCIFNMITAMAEVTVEKLFAFPETEELCFHIFREIQAVASAEDVDLQDNQGKKIIASARKLKGFETSTYQDRQKGKKLEYEAFTGAIVRLATKHKLEVPHNQTLYALLKLIDNDS